MTTAETIFPPNFICPKFCPSQILNGPELCWVDGASILGSFGVEYLDVSECQVNDVCVYVCVFTQPLEQSEPLQM